MTLFKRLWNCAKCGKPVYYDDDTNQVSCKCSVEKIRFSPRDLYVNFVEISEQLQQTLLLESVHPQGNNSIEKQEHTDRDKKNGRESTEST